MMEMKTYFSNLTDSTDNRGLGHDLGNIIVMSIYAVLCGYTDAENMAFFMKLQEPYLKKCWSEIMEFLLHDILLHVFAIIDP